MDGMKIPGQHPDSWNAYADADADAPKVRAFLLRSTIARFMPRVMYNIMSKDPLLVVHKNFAKVIPKQKSGGAGGCV